MKKTIITIIIVLIFLISGCDKPAPNLKSINSNDVVYDFPNWRSDVFNDVLMAPCENGMYILLTDVPFIFYRDNETGISVPVCNKPDCLHDKEESKERIMSCNAYVGYSSPSVLQMYGGELYVIVTDCNEELNQVTIKLCTIATDGSGLHPVYDFPFDDEDFSVTQGGSAYLNATYTSIKIHRGYLYYMLGDSKTKLKLYRVPMDDLKSEPVLLFEQEGNTIGSNSSHVEGDKIYFSVFYNEEVKGEFYSNSKLYCLDTTTLVVNEIDQNAPAACQIVNGEIVYTKIVYDDPEARTNGHLVRITRNSEDFSVISEDDFSLIAHEYGIFHAYFRYDNYFLFDNFIATLKNPDVPYKIVLLDINGNIAGVQEVKTNGRVIPGSCVIDGYYYFISVYDKVVIYRIYLPDIINANQIELEEYFSY